MEPTLKLCVLINMSIVPTLGTPVTTSPELCVSAAVGSHTLVGPFAGHRFQFRPFTLSDVSRLAAIACEYRVDITSIGVPDPYTTEFARMWSRAAASKESSQTLHWAVTRVGETRLLGYAALNKIDHGRRQAELRVWAACTTAQPMAAASWSQAIIQFALERVNLERIYALQLARHPVTGQLLRSIGMQPEGMLRKRMHREGPFEDVICWEILKRNWKASE